MSKKKWYPVVSIDDIPLREGKCATFGAHRIAIFNVGGTYQVIDNVCPHKQGPLADGIIAGNTVTCPLHNWKISLESGKVTAGGEGSVKVYPTQVLNGMVYVAFEHTESISPEPKVIYTTKPTRYFNLWIIIRPSKWYATRKALEEVGCFNYLRHRVFGRGEQFGLRFDHDKGQTSITLLPKWMIQVTVEKGLMESALCNAMEANRTGRHGDGKIFVTPLEEITEESIIQEEEMTV